MLITLPLFSLTALSFLPRISSDISFSPSVAAFLELVKLTDRTCNSIEWCVFVKANNTQYTKSNAFMEMWYGGCSCQETCLSDKTCCPDFKLRNILKNKVYLNGTEFVSEILNTRSITSMNMTVDYENVFEVSDNVPMDCVQPRLYSRTRFKPMGTAYRMVTTCFNPYVDKFLKSKCEARERVADLSNIDDFLPVQSLVTGIVYRNKPCFSCSSEVYSEYKEWDIYIASSYYTPRFRAYPLSYDDVVTMVKQGSTHDLLFEPNDELKRRFTPKLCFNIDVNTCTSHNETVASHLDMACRSYLLPVFTGKVGVHTVFNNLACYYCHKGYQLEQSDKCIYFNTPIYVGKLQHQRTDGVWRSLTADSTDENTGERIGIFVSPRCGEGRIYDRQKETCRDVYCPCGMVAENSTCVHIFQKISNRKFDIYVSIKSDNDFPTNITLASRYEQALFQYFEDEIGTKFVLEKLVLWKAEGTSKQAEHIVFLMFSGRQTYISFLDTILYLKQTLYGSKIFVKNNASFTAVLAVTDSIRTMNDDAIHVTNKKRYRLARSFIAPFVSTFINSEQIISECHFCYRIEVAKEEFEVILQGIFIKQTGHVVTTRSRSTILNTQRSLICIDKELTEIVSHVAENDTDTNAMPDPIDLDEITEVGTSETHIEKGLAAIVVLGLIVIAVALLSIFKFRRERSVSSNTSNTNQGELDMASDIRSVTETAVK